MVKLKLTFFATIISLHSALLMYCVNKSLSPSLQESNNCSFRLFGFGSLRHIVTIQTQNLVLNIPTCTRNHGNNDFLRNNQTNNNWNFFILKLLLPITEISKIKKSTNELVKCSLVTIICLKIDANMIDPVEFFLFTIQYFTVACQIEAR